MSVLGTAYVINDNTSNTPGALPLVGDVPAGAQLALILIRFDGSTASVSIDSLESSFGDVTILGQTSGFDSNAAVAYVTVDDWGSGHTITPTTSGSFYFGQVYGFAFLDGVDTSSQAAWLRDFDVQWSNGVATATVDTQEGDLAFGGISNWNQSPSTPAGCTSLIDPNGGFEIRQRVVQQDAPADGTASFSSGDSYGAAAAISVIQSASGSEVSAGLDAKAGIVVVASSAMQAAAPMAASAGVSAAASAGVDRSLSLGVTSSITLSTAVAVERSVGLIVTAAMSHTAGRVSDAEASLSAAGAVAAAAGLTVETDLLFASLASIETGGLATVNILIGLGAAAAHSASSSAQAGANLTLPAVAAEQLLAAAVSNAGLSFSAISNITVAGTTTSGDIITPDGRILRVMFDNRVLATVAEDRTHIVKH